MREGKGRRRGGGERGDRRRGGEETYAKISYQYAKLLRFSFLFCWGNITRASIGERRYLRHARWLPGHERWREQDGGEGEKGEVWGGRGVCRGAAKEEEGQREKEVLVWGWGLEIETVG